MLLFSYNTILYSNQILFAVLNEQKSKKIEKKPGMTSRSACQVHPFDAITN